MSNAVRASIDYEPIPVDEHGMVRAVVTADASGWRTSWAFDGGRRKEPFGLPHPTARAAADVAGRINARGQDVGVTR